MKSVRLMTKECPWLPLAPLRVALSSIEADAMQTAFVRSFFKNSGVPSGIIKIKGRSLKDEAAEGIRFFGLCK